MLITKHRCAPFRALSSRPIMPKRTPRWRSHFGNSQYSLRSQKHLFALTRLFHQASRFGSSTSLRLFLFARCTVCPQKLRMSDKMTQGNGTDTSSIALVSGSGAVSNCISTSKTAYWKRPFCACRAIECVNDSTGIETT